MVNFHHLEQPKSDYHRILLLTVQTTRAAAVLSEKVEQQFAYGQEIAPRKIIIPANRHVMRQVTSAMMKWNRINRRQNRATAIDDRLFTSLQIKYQRMNTNARFV